MIKKIYVFKWGNDERESFQAIKQAIIDAPSLITPNFYDPFILYTFSFELSYVAVLTQINDQNIGAPISFFSSNFQGEKLNYSKVEKHAFTVFKIIKHFRPFLLKSHTKVIVPFSVMRQLLVQKEFGEKRENWVTNLQEYDLDIKIIKIVRGQGFCRLITRASNISANEDSGNKVQISEVCLTNTESQYVDLLFYLKNGYAPPELNHKRERALRLKAKQYEIIDGVLFKRIYDSILLRCVQKSKAEKKNCGTYMMG